jgi:hypothetical protein
VLSHTTYVRETDEDKVVNPDMHIDKKEGKQTFITGGKPSTKAIFTSFHDLAPLITDKEMR